MTVHPSSSNRRAAPSVEKTIAFAALRHRDYRRYFFVHFFSTMGDNIDHVISYWLLGGFAVISHWTPFLFFARSILARSPIDTIVAGSFRLRSCSTPVSR